MVFQNTNFKICLSLFGCEVSILPKVHIVHCNCTMINAMLVLFHENYLFIKNYIDASHQHSKKVLPPPSGYQPHPTTFRASVMIGRFFKIDSIKNLLTRHVKTKTLLPPCHRQSLLVECWTKPRL